MSLIDIAVSNRVPLEHRTAHSHLAGTTLYSAPSPARHHQSAGVKTIVIRSILLTM